MEQPGLAASGQMAHGWRLSHRGAGCPSILRTPIGMAYAGMVVWLSVALVGCAILSPPLHGVSGPIAWQATDLRVVEREVSAQKRELYAFTLVLKETQNTAITFNQVETTISQAGLNEAGVSNQATILWKLPPRGELRRPLSFYWFCTSFDCERADLSPAPQYDIRLTGTDDRGQPVQAKIALHLPHRSSMPKSQSAPVPTRDSHPAHATAATEASPPVPIQVVSNTILVNAVLNDTEYVALLLDTGASQTIVTPDTAKRLGIHPPSDAPEHNAVVFGGQNVTFSYTQLDSLRIGETTVEDLQLGVALVFPEAPLVDGVVGGDILQRFTLTWNYATSRLQLQPTTSAPASPPRPGPISVGVARNLPWVKVKLNGVRQETFLLDTGASRTFVHPNVAKKVGIRLAADAPQATTTVFGGRKVTFPIAPLSAIAVGEATVEGLQIGVFLALPKAHTVGGILGGDFLRHFTVTLDYKNRQMWLESNAAAQPPEKS